MTRDSFRIAAFQEQPAVATRSRLFLRHDIDTAACVERAHLLLDAGLARGLPAAVFLRTDGTDYDPKQCRDLVSGYRRCGVEFGLHSSAYLSEDYVARFKREIDDFADAFGFPPRTFTVHGLGELHAARREAFAREVVSRLGDFGIEFTDCLPEQRPYHYWVQDCDLEPGTGRRIMYDDMAEFPRLPRFGHNYLVLTHPCYWTQ